MRKIDKIFFENLRRNYFYETSYFFVYGNLRLVDRG